MTSRYYILGGKDGHEAVESEPLSLAQLLGDINNRIVKQERIGSFFISTVFLGLDYNFARYLRGTNDSRPVLFETMVFDDSDEDRSVIYQDRCSTWDEALAMHARAVEAATVKV